MIKGLVDESGDGVIEKLAGYRWWRLEFDGQDYVCEIGRGSRLCVEVRGPTVLGVINGAIERWERSRQ